MNEHTIPRSNGGKPIECCWYEAEKVVAVCVGLHGGCFQDGDHTYNDEQLADYAKVGLSTLHINYSLADPESAINDTVCAINHLREKYKDIPVGVLGSSSGGYTALRVYNDGLADFCIGLCPVSSPLKWYNYLESKEKKDPLFAEMKSKLLKHFISLENIQALPELDLKPDNLQVILGSSDDIVPFTVNDDLSYTSMYIAHSDHNLCWQPDKQTTTIVKNFINKYSKKENV